MSVLEFIAAIKWPIVVLVLIGVTIRGAKNHPEALGRVAAYFEKRDISGKAGPVEIHATTAAAVEQAAAVSAASDQELIAIAGPPDFGQPDDGVPRASAQTLRRDAVEDVMRASAQWGWEMAQMGFQTPPDPHIEWSDDGRPSIMFGTGSAIERMLAAQIPTRLTPEELARRAAAGYARQWSEDARQAAIRRRLDEVRREQEGQ